MKSEITNSILVDDLKRAESLIVSQPQAYELFLDLLKKVKTKPKPLKALKSKAPGVINISLSYKCELKCEMCISGFHDRTYLFDDYKYFLPDQFEKLSSWIQSASNIFFVGQGETLNTPYLNYFLNKIHDKSTTIYTSGVPINKKVVQSLIYSKLDTLVLSFDGKSSIGHGKGKEKYIKQFWGKVKLIQNVKKINKSNKPDLQLYVTVCRENISNLDEIIDTASKQKISHVMLVPLSPRNNKIYRKSIYVDYLNSINKINSILSKWNKKGMLVTVFGYKKRIKDSFRLCPYVDNWLHFEGKRNMPGICCEAIEMPLKLLEFPQKSYWNSFPLRYFRYLHFCSSTGDLPYRCKTCWRINLKKFSESCKLIFNNSDNKTPPYLLKQYRAASELKQKNVIKKAERLFLEILEHETSPEFKANVYFHLGEIELKKEDYKKALFYMKLAVQYNFDHAMAFAYLYLLLMLYGREKVVKRRKKFAIVTLNL